MTPQRGGAPGDEPGAHAETHGRAADANGTPPAEDVCAQINDGTTTLYMVNADVLASPDTYALDAEQRSRDRGCTCTSPIFRHYMGETLTTVVDHTSTSCPLRRQP